MTLRGRHKDPIDLPGTPREKFMKYWSMDRDAVTEALGGNPAGGLSSTEAEARLEQYGPNRLAQERRLTFLAVFWEEVREPMILLLLVVGILYSVWGAARDAITIFSVIAVLVLVEIFTEYRAKKAVNSLRRLSPPTARVLRDGVTTEVLAAGLVPGDILLIGTGDLVPADARLLEAYGIEADESALTGESLPVAKSTEAVAEETLVAERINFVYTGTMITRGKGAAVVTSTGMETELGRIQGLVWEAKEPKTPLQLAMKQLAGLLVYVAIFFSAIIPVIGIIQGKAYKEMVLTGLSLSFATIPEELPIIITMVLGVGAFTLSKRGVLVKRLKAAETLGSVTVIATDKTGTITENRMRLSFLGGPASGGSTGAFHAGSLSDADRLMLTIGMLTSDVLRTDGEYLGDPMEVAIYRAAQEAGLPANGDGGELRLQCEYSFGSDRKVGSSVYTDGATQIAYVKGAPEAVMQRSDRILRAGEVMPLTEEDGRAIAAMIERLAREAMRVLAFAYREGGDCSSPAGTEDKLIFAGLAGFLDPPREGVSEAVRATSDAGMRSIVISGDHPVTVERIAAQVGIDTSRGILTGTQLDGMDDAVLKDKLQSISLFARTAPEHKYRIVNALRSSGEVVAVTGDGINDAPALKTADIGIAMGETGTDVAKETADMVLTDDSYVSVVSGVREGRKIFDNLSKGVRYYLACKLALVLILVVPVVLNIPFPLAPIQIILLELFMDIAASATFVAEPAEFNLMSRPPRDPSRRFVDREMMLTILAGSISLAAAVTFNYLFVYYTKGHDTSLAQTVAFGTWLAGHVMLAINMRSTKEPLYRLGFFANKAMLLWAVLAIGFFALVTLIEPLRNVVHVVSLSWKYWLAILAVTFIATFWMEAKKVAFMAMARLGREKQAVPVKR